MKQHLLYNAAHFDTHIWTSGMKEKTVEYTVFFPTTNSNMNNISQLESKYID